MNQSFVNPCFIRVSSVGSIFAVVWFRTGMTHPSRRTAWMLATAAVIDFVVTLLLAGGPGLTIY
jgi:hypothetical protein